MRCAAAHALRIAVDAMNTAAARKLSHAPSDAPRATSASPDRRRVAVCGLGERSVAAWIPAMLDAHRDRVALVGVLDADPRRFEVLASRCPGAARAPRYAPAEFTRMLDATRPDAVLVAGVDDTHADPIVAALARDLDVIVEKPMVTTAADARRVLDAAARSRGRVAVTFNLRYPRVHRAIRDLVAGGAVGRVTHVDLHWSLDRVHGASYFRRWHRERARSGGLAVHKGSHHFDLARWWIDDAPVEVFAHAMPARYGAASPWAPPEGRGADCAGCTADCALRRAAHGDGVTAGARDPAGYSRLRTDACVFDEGIDVEDGFVATVRFRRGAVLSYSADFASPYEGYRLAISGTAGRIETRKYLAPQRLGFDAPPQELEVFDLHGRRAVHRVTNEGGHHEGGDAALMADLLGRRGPSGLCADARDGALAVAVGEAVGRSVATGRAVRVDELLGAGVGL